MTQPNRVLLAGLAALTLLRLIVAAWAPLAPDVPLKPNAYSVDWARFGHLAEVARDTPPAERLADVARALKSNVPAEAGNLSPLDWYCLGNGWWCS